MDKIEISATEKTPRIYFNPEQNIFEISGTSTPEDIKGFYYPIIQKVQDYYQYIVEKDHIDDLLDNPFIICFKLVYFNSATAKIVSDILMKSNDFYYKGLNIKIHWYYEPGDDDMKEMGMDLSELIDLPVHYYKL